jgi:hypothetical protein
LEYEVVKAPEHGRLEGKADSPEWTYTPNPDYYGHDRFEYRVTDGTDASNTALVSLSIGSVSDYAPAVTKSKIKDMTIAVNEVAGPMAFHLADADPQDDPGKLSIYRSSNNNRLVPGKNIVVGGKGEKRTLTVTPAAGETGRATIELLVTDRERTAKRSFTLTVTPGK